MLIIAMLTAAMAADVELAWNGRLTDVSGVPINGSTPLTLNLYNSDTSGPAPAWTQAYTPELSGGYFSVSLGADPANPLSDALLAHRPVEIEVVLPGGATQRQTLLDVPFAARAASVSAAAVTTALAEATCDSGAVGAIGFDAATGTLRVCDGGKWATVWSRTGQGTSGSPGYSCLQILQDGHSTGSGAYWIDGDGPGSAPSVRTHCDMEKDGGGWTMVAYLGTITTNKATTVGSTNWLPLFFDFGTVDGDSHTSRTPFSRLDAFTHLFRDDSTFLAYRTSRPTHQMLWPVTSVSEWESGVLPYVRWLKLTNDGSNYVVRSRDLAVYHRTPNSYTGYDWNAVVSGGETNCDNCGNSYNTGLGHRSLLYWETGDSSYTADQWFHAQPLSLVDSTGPDNSAQDVAIYLRESAR